MNNIDKLNILKNDANAVILDKGYEVKEDDNNVYNLLNSTTKQVVGYIIVINDEQDIYNPTTYNIRTRSCRSNEEKTCHIPILSIDKSHRGKGLATLLFIYAISSFLSTDNTDIKFITLDDDSDRSNELKNIYTRLGFVISGKTKLTNYNTIELPGPEKEARVSEFIRRAQLILHRYKTLQKKIHNKIQQILNKNNRTTIGLSPGAIQRRPTKGGKSKTKKRHYKHRKKSTRCYYKNRKTLKYSLKS